MELPNLLRREDLELTVGVQSSDRNGHYEYVFKALLKIIQQRQISNIICRKRKNNAKMGIQSF
jgi:hypothetical protein